MKLLCSAALVFALALPCFAQQAGFRDLTLSWRAPDDHLPPPPEHCSSVNSTFSKGAMVKGVQTPSAAPEQRDKIEISIVELTPAKLRVGDAFTATVRVKNAGAQSFNIPWQPDGEQATKMSQDGTEEEYEVADVTFRLVTGEKKNTPTPLESDGALFARTSDPSTYIEIPPGHWVEIKLKGAAECGLDRCLTEVKPDQQAVLTAWWYERVLTHKVKDCNEDHGSYEVREADSAPFHVAILPSTAAGGNWNQISASPTPIGILRAGARLARSQSLGDFVQSGR
jgi:hypothetical protein